MDLIAEERGARDLGLPRRGRLVTAAILGGCQGGNGAVGDVMVHQVVLASLAATVLPSQPSARLRHVVAEYKNSSETRIRWSRFEVTLTTVAVVGRYMVRRESTAEATGT